MATKLYYDHKEKQSKPLKDDVFFTVNEAAKYANYSVSSIRRWIKTGELEEWENDDGTALLVRKADLDSFITKSGRA